MTDEFSTDLVALLCVYNEEEMLPGCLESLEGKVDRIVVADGRYKMYPGEGGPSTDRTLSVASQCGCTVIHSPPAGWNTEHEKRTALVRSGKPGDEYLVIDADERLQNGHKLRDFYGDFTMQVVGTGGTPGRTSAVRLFAHRDGLEYRWHFGLFSPAGIPVLRSRDALPMQTAWIDHRHVERDPERCEADKEYEALLVPMEREIGAYK